MTNEELAENVRSERRRAHHLTCKKIAAFGVPPAQQIHSDHKQNWRKVFAQRHVMLNAGVF